MLHKYCLHHSHHKDIVPTNAVISDVRIFLDDHRHGDLPHVQCTSTVHYMELLDENPDCVEMVAEDLIARFDGVQDGWVVLVGDGKTYRHLMNVKKQYSTMLRKILLFPGDWHILKNYQPILMKEWEALYREMWHTYVLFNTTNITEDATCILYSLLAYRQTTHQQT